MTPTEIFLQKLNEIPVELEDDRVSFVMEYLQYELAEQGKFEEFQHILDNVDPNDVKGATVLTIKLCSWWYGKFLIRKPYFDKAFKYYETAQGYDQAKRIMGECKEGDSWKPMFGGTWERQIFGISK